MIPCRSIIDGQTGSGKTFKAIHMAKELGKFIYSAPCRQLVYETVIKYGSKNDSIMTGELHNAGSDNYYCVYESVTESLIDSVNTLIIDEAHFLSDEDRGGHLYNLIQYCISKNKNIFLVSATRNFKKIKGFKLLKLKSLFDKKILKKRITYKEYEDRLRAGVPSIRFLRYKSDAYMYAASLTADDDAYTRLRLQLAFSRGEITSIAATNVIAQGLNFPAQNVLIEYNPYDSDELIQQKIGRLGRYGMYDGQELTYCLFEVPKRIKKDKKIVKVCNDDLIMECHINSYYHNLSMWIREKMYPFFVGAPLHEMPMSKYGMRRTVQFFQSLTKDDFEKMDGIEQSEFGYIEKKCIDFLDTEFKLKNLILENLRGKK